MRIAVTGSIATDHLMTFPGRFADSLVADQLDKVSLSFLVEDLDVRRGGVAANIAFGMGALGPEPVAGRRGRAATSPTTAPGWSGTASTPASVHVSELRHTARFVCTTDADHNQIASLLPRRDERGPRHRARRRSPPGSAASTWSLVGANDPEAMLRHTDECRTRGYPVRGRPLAAARLDGRRGDPPAHRRRGLPVHQRVRGRR